MRFAMAFSDQLSSLAASYENHLQEWRASGGNLTSLILPQPPDCTDMDNTASARKDVVKGTENDSEVKNNGNTEEKPKMESESSCNSNENENGEMEVGSLWPVWRDPTAHLSESAGTFWRTHGDPD